MCGGGGGGVYSSCVRICTSFSRNPKKGEKKKPQPTTSCLNRSLDNAADWCTVFHGDKLGFNGQYVYYRNSSVWVSVWCETQRLCVCVLETQTAWGLLRRDVKQEKVNSLKINSFSLDVGGKNKNKKQRNTDSTHFSISVKWVVISWVKGCKWVNYWGIRTEQNKVATHVPLFLGLMSVNS